MAREFVSGNVIEVGIPAALLRYPRFCLALVFLESSCTEGVTPERRGDQGGCHGVRWWERELIRSFTWADLAAEFVWTYVACGQDAGAGRKTCE